MDDNIPLRVMLLLMDEVFDLKEKNQWLRRNIKNLLQQLIRATYGDTINRSESRLNKVHKPWEKCQHIYSRLVKNIHCVFAPLSSSSFLHIMKFAEGGR